jgi:hypothetical protein
MNPVDTLILSNDLKPKVEEGVNQNAKPVHDRLHASLFYFIFNLPR